MVVTDPRLEQLLAELGRPVPPPPDRRKEQLTTLLRMIAAALRDDVVEPMASAGAAGYA
jgi:hypothetical protein